MVIVAGTSPRSNNFVDRPAIVTVERRARHGVGGGGGQTDNIIIKKNPFRQRPRGRLINVIVSKSDPSGAFGGGDDTDNNARRQYDDEQCIIIITYLFGGCRGKTIISFGTCARTARALVSNRFSTRPARLINHASVNIRRGRWDDCARLRV